VAVPAVRTPSYRLHKPSGQAVVTIAGRDRYLGKYDTPESRSEYHRLIAEWHTNSRRLAPRTPGVVEVTINQVMREYLAFADGYYTKDGQPTKEPEDIGCALRPLMELYGHTPAKDFGPRALKVVRQALIDSGLCRNEVNKRVGKIKRAFRWAVSEEKIPGSVIHALDAVSGLGRGRSEARESEPVRRVPDPFVDAIQTYVSRQVWSMIQLQRLTGARSGEILTMRGCDLDLSGPTWTYTPSRHKTQHHARPRTIALGPKAQAILRPWLRTDLGSYLFQPIEALGERQAEKRRNRRTPVQPSQRNRAKPRPKKQPGARYPMFDVAHRNSLRRKHQIFD
jgi:integrase